MPLYTEKRLLTVPEQVIPVETVNNYKAYLIRLWRSDPHAPWRASAQNTRTGEQHYFTSPENLYLFLHEATNDKPDLES
jgi:hypothetical protein